MYSDDYSPKGQLKWIFPSFTRNILPPKTTSIVDFSFNRIVHEIPTFQAIKLYTTDQIAYHNCTAVVFHLAIGPSMCQTSGSSPRLKTDSLIDSVLAPEVQTLFNASRELPN